jgi:hypothetical protein
MINKSDDKWCELNYIKALIAINQSNFEKAKRILNKLKPGALSVSNMMFTAGNAFRMSNETSMAI